MLKKIFAALSAIFFALIICFLLTANVEAISPAYVITAGIPIISFLATVYLKKQLAFLPSLASVIVSAVIIAIKPLNQLMPLALILSAVPALLFNLSLLKSKKTKKLSEILKLAATHFTAISLFSFLYFTVPESIKMKCMILTLIVYLVLYGVYSVLLTDSWILPIPVFAAVQLVIFVLESFFVNVLTDDYTDSNFTTILVIMPFIYYIGVLIISLLTRYVKNKIKK